MGHNSFRKVAILCRGVSGAFSGKHPQRLHPEIKKHATNLLEPAFYCLVCQLRHLQSDGHVLVVTRRVKYATVQ